MKDLQFTNPDSRKMADHWQGRQDDIQDLYEFYGNQQGLDPQLLKAVAIVESIIFLLQNNIEKLKDKDSQSIIISGGLSALNGLCQKLADLSGLEVDDILVFNNSTRELIIGINDDNSVSVLGMKSKDFIYQGDYTEAIGKIPQERKKFKGPGHVEYLSDMAKLREAGIVE